MLKSTIYASPSRITEAREARKYNMTQLANLLGVTKQAISQYEHNLSHPSSKLVEKMANILNFPVSFFYKYEDNSSEGTVFFRSFKSSEATERSMIQVKCRWAREAYEFLSKQVKMPALNLPKLDFLLSKPELTKDDIEQIAYMTRKYWNLGNGPIDNLTYILEKNGIVISGSYIDGDKTDACSIIRDGVPIIFCNKRLRSACRIRFSLAHELGHILLHGHITKEDLKAKDVLQRIEHEADLFASAFLMPEESFAIDIRSISLRYFILLKEKWKASLQAIIVRCKQLQLIDDTTYNYLWRQLSFKKWRKSEPLDDEIIQEPPKLLCSALMFLCDNSEISKQQIKNTFCWSIDDLSEIFGINKTFFTEPPSFESELKLL